MYREIDRLKYEFARLTDRCNGPEVERIRDDFNPRALLKRSA